MQNLYWRNYAGVQIRHRVSRDFVKVWDPESKGTFYVDQTTMRGRMHIPTIAVDVLHEYSDKACYTNQVTINAIRPRELTAIAQKLKHELLVQKAATVVQTKYLEPNWRGSFMLQERLEAVIVEAIEWDNERKIKKNYPKDQMLSAHDSHVWKDITNLLCHHQVIYAPVPGGVKYRVEAEHRDPIWEEDEGKK